MTFYRNYQNNQTVIETVKIIHTFLTKIELVIAEIFMIISKKHNYFCQFIYVLKNLSIKVYCVKSSPIILLNKVFISSQTSFVQIQLQLFCSDHYSNTLSTCLPLQSVKKGTERPMVLSKFETCRRLWRVIRACRTS